MEELNFKTYVCEINIECFIRKMIKKINYYISNKSMHVQILTLPPPRKMSAGTYDFIAKKKQIRRMGIFLQNKSINAHFVMHISEDYVKLGGVGGRFPHNFNYYKYNVTIPHTRQLIKLLYLLILVFSCTYIPTSGQVGTVLLYIKEWGGPRTRVAKLMENLVLNFQLLATYTNILDSERSDECIDFTMNITSRNNAPISNYGVVSDVKVNILEVKVNIFQQFSKKSRKTKKKMTEKREFLRKTSFRQIVFLYGCNSKTNHCKYLKFSQNTIEIFNFSNSNLYEICQNCENLQIILWLENHKIFSFITNKSRRYLKILPNLPFGVFRPLKHKPPVSPTTGNYILG
ncbi:hypothetical protein AGLY_008786 [Aphis glycines]|uniref:Uncharacterized protein n=1 Tax=Aphis glycines TaxID=307491 RepID=A0A6G0TJM8_APHGL|nr:hypothetical protein AGLY_008786 [Aphis glycines]